MRLKRKVRKKSWAMMLMGFKQGSTELLLERIMLVADWRAGFEGQGCKLKDQVMATVQLDPQGAGTREVTVELERWRQAREI